MINRLLAVTAATMGVLFVLVLIGSASLGIPEPALASPGAVHTVCPAGPPLCDYSVIQDAIDSANDGDTIKIATGTYTGVSERAGVTQTVYISKSVTLRGGYTTAFADPPDAQANPTTLDAQGQGRVVYMAGLITPTLAGLRLANGATSDSGAGVYVLNASPVISNCQIYNNSANAAGGGVYLYASANILLIGNRIYDNEALFGVGGGVYLYSGLSVSLADNQVFSNTTGSSGGGIYIGNSDNVTIWGNTVYSNTASNGGGILLSVGESVTLAQNQFMGNSATSFGGGVYLVNSKGAMLTGNHLSNNVATSGGGMYANYGSGPVGAQLDGNSFMENEADLGGAAYLFGDDTAFITMTNNLVVENFANPGGDGSGLYIKGFSPTLLHTTIARNTGGTGSGVSVSSGGVIMTNTILVSQTTGIIVPNDSVAMLGATLWGSGAWANGDDWSGTGTILTGTINLWGDPAFVQPESGDYHLGADSAAVDAGVDAGVDTDIDSQLRPYQAPDLGADEYWPEFVHLPIVKRNDP